MEKMRKSYRSHRCIKDIDGDFMRSVQKEREAAVAAAAAASQAASVVDDVVLLSSNSGNEIEEPSEIDIEEMKLILSSNSEGQFGGGNGHEQEELDDSDKVPLELVSVDQVSTADDKHATGTNLLSASNQAEEMVSSATLAQEGRPKRRRKKRQ